MSDEALTPPPSEVTKTSLETLEVGDYEEYEKEWQLEEAEVEEILEAQIIEEEEVYYDTSDFISKPYLSPGSTVPENVLEFDYSYGYDCQRLFNLCVVDKTVLLFASGNIIHFFDTESERIWFRRSYSGCGIGHITKNPKENHIAVGEKGENPLIIIYEWPSFDIVTILKGGTKTAYTFLNYSPDGELLASQGSQPDYMLTIWNWRKHRIMLRSKAYGSTVFNSSFSLYEPGHLTSSGVGHIKFWRIDKTFTGLKLLGELGRFGKSEICNVIGFLALPDEKVVSSCEWGNILVWDGGLIRVEVFRRGKNFCHEAPITQFIYNNGDLMTVAMDGTIKVWYYETIELADPPEEERYIEVEPIFEYEIGDYYHKARLLVIVESDPEDPEDFTWFGQDGNGGIWKLDLSMNLNAETGTQILQCHSGSVAAIQCSPFSNHLASLGEDGRIFIYDYKLKKMLFKKEFLAAGCSLLWLPLAVEESGCVLIGGFSDGVVRVICVSLHEYMKKIPSPTEDYINLIQVLKPHTKAITVITINPKNSIIVTGSQDCTIFVFQIKESTQYPKLVPVGYVPVSGEVTHCTWKPRRDATILVCCHNGTFMEIDLPVESVDLDPVSYLLKGLNKNQQTFVSIKSEIMRNLRFQEILAERQAKIEAMKEELKKRSAESGISEHIASLEAFKEELEAEEPELPDVFIPKIPSPILFAIYTVKSIWLSMGGYDAGYMYEYEFYKEGPVSWTKVANGNDVDITYHHYYYNNKYLILGMKNGEIRVVRTNPFDTSDLSNYWSLAMHDSDNGKINQICFDYKYSYMFTCGSDGNIFSYKFMSDTHDHQFVNPENVNTKGFPGQIASDIDDPAVLSLEQAMNRMEYEERMKQANSYKRDMIEVLKGLEKNYEALLKRNSKLPKSQQLSPEDLELDKRLNEDLKKQIEEEMGEVKLKLAWPAEKIRLQHEKLYKYYLDPIEMHLFKVQGISNKDIYAESFTLKKLGKDFELLKKLVVHKLEEQEAKGRGQAKHFSEETLVDTITRRPNPVEGLLKQIMVLCGDYKKNIKLRRLLRKYRERKDRMESRRIVWYEMMKKKPNPEKHDPEDMAQIELAKETVGDYQLKTAQDYKVPKDAKITTVHVYNQLLKTREAIYNIKKNYNEKVIKLRQRKLEMIERHEHLREILLEIAKEIPKEKIRYPPNMPTFTEDVEFPEKKFQHTEQGIYEELPKRYKAMYVPEQPKKKELKLLDREYELLILEKKGQKLGKVHSRLNLMKYSGITGSGDIKALEEAGHDDQVPTPWEKELKKMRVVKRLYEQDGIIDEMDTGIKEFDEEICRLRELKVKTEVDLKLLELHLLTLHQEVLILKKFEAAEDEKEAKLFQKLKEKHETQKKMSDINFKVEGRNREIRRCEEEIKNLVTMFHATTAENKFYDFLKRIFKKKYRPPKTKTDDSDSESESESSSSSEEEDAKSLDSKEIGPIRLDESVCPPGCDPELYNWTFTQRTARHGFELNIIEEKKHIDAHKKEYDALLKKIKQVEAQYQICKEDLEEYMREKQRNLNEVETVVVLRMNQIQNLKSESELEKISESVLFSSSSMSNLYKRVGELEKETQMERQKHEKNRQHLTRMKIDINHMKEMIIKLNTDIDETMIKKFGTKVDMDDIEETLLKRLVAEMHSVVLELKNNLKKKLQEVKQNLIEKQNQYARKLQDNTERYNLITVLQEEKMRILALSKKEERLMCVEKHKDDEEQEKDLENLRRVAKQQEEKIAELKKEIGKLKLKVKVKPPLNNEQFPEVIQRLVIKGCRGDMDEISDEVRDDLKDMYDEGLEIVRDAKDGDFCEEDRDRMKKLTTDILEKLPEKYRLGVIRRLSKGVIKEEPISQRVAEGIILEIVKTLRTDSFLEALQIVKEIIDSIIPSFDPVSDP